MTKDELILSLVQLIEPKEEKDALIKAAAIYLMGPVTNQVTEPKTSEPDTDGQKPNEIKTYYKKRVKIDTGKLGALRRAGWSVTKIADEFGVSAPTIRNYMKREGIQ